MDSQGVGYAEQAYGGPGYGEQTYQIGDLGRFSMRAIYDALANAEQMNSGIPGRRQSRQVDPEDSDCSWTQDDDNGTFYSDMQSELSSFAASGDQPNMTTAFLSKPQRRFVHATAQTMRLGHASLGPQGKLRRMIVFKDATSFMPSASVPPPQATIDTTSYLAPDPSFSKKRRRLERVENGFPCPSCDKVFDRASERKKHEQAHQPDLTSRFQCSLCGKGFRYPKDLRRHYKVHEKTLAAGAGAYSLGSSFGSSALDSSAITADSRVPSDTSLTFSSNTVSKNVSPSLVGRIGGAIPELDLEPLVLHEDAWTGVAVDDWLLDPQSGFANADDEDFLEMAKVRK